MKSFQAYAKGSSVTKESPQKAARAFFEAFPTKRKCSIIEGKSEGGFFSVTYGMKSEGEWPQSWKDVTKKMIDQLPA